MLRKELKTRWRMDMPPIDVAYILQRAEDSKEKWVGHKDGVEYLFVRCETCGHSYARQQVIRIAVADFAVWRKAKKDERKKFISLQRHWVAFVITMTCFFGLVGGYMWSFSGNAAGGAFVGAMVGMIFAAVMFHKLPYFSTQSNEELAQTIQKNILERAELKIEPDEVSLDGDMLPRKYVLMATE
ncbi:MAG TPA: hypothetical protein VGP13_02420 [Candidatus Paceibacterota bacterium]|jgi:hypothetical protein|nr:hypothetical protein [Candidatus Paceibacterota bacterium]